MTGVSVANTDAAVVYMTSIDGNMSAINSSSGSLLWGFSAKGGIMGIPFPSISGQAVYVGSMDASLYALSAASGTELWKFTALYLESMVM